MGAGLTKNAVAASNKILLLFTHPDQTERPLPSSGFSVTVLFYPRNCLDPERDRESALGMRLRTEQKENRMKLTTNWHGNKRTHKPKRVGPKPKIPGQLSAFPDPVEDQQSNSMDEVRRQVVLMSSSGFRDPVQSRPSKPSEKGQGRNQHAKPRHGATK